MNKLLFDDDCSVCTRFAQIISKFLKGASIESMSKKKIEEEGLSTLGSIYWNSFHVIKNGIWYSDKEAIVKLSSLFPLGRMWEKVTSVPIISFFLVNLLRYFQKMRKLACNTKSQKRHNIKFT